MTVEPWGSGTASPSTIREAGLVDASVVIDALLDVRLDSPSAAQRDLIDELLLPLSHRRLMTPDEVRETMAALDGIDGLDVPRRRRVHRPGHSA